MSDKKKASKFYNLKTEIMSDGSTSDDDNIQMRYCK